MKITDIQPRTKIGKFIWQFLWTPIVLVLAFTPLLMINLLQFPSLILLPFSKNLFRAYNRAAAAAVWGWWAWGVTKVIGLEVEQSGDIIPAEENAIVISNHQGMGDILILLCLALKKKRMGDIKWMVKDVLKYVPGLGWGMLFLECVFLKRSWNDDKAKIISAFEKFRKDQIPLWMILFPEGTRITPEKLRKSQAFAQKNQLHPSQYTLVPRTKGFYTALLGLKDYIDVIYSVTIVYEEKVPGLLNLMRGDVKRVRCHVQRVSIQEIPSEETRVNAWLIEHFLQKDKLIERLN